MICKHRNLYQNLDKFEIPYVFIQGIYSEMRDKPHILMDDAQGGYLVTKYLLELGHKKIKGFFKADDMQGLERHKGYVKALQESGIAYDPDDVVWFHTEDRKVKPALMAKEMVQSGQLPDGIVCYNDQIAVQVMEELEKMGVRIPDDISITGYDNSLYAQRGNGITTIAHPQEKLGEMAAELILEKINGVPEEESKVERLIYPELIIRGSCRKLNKNDQILTVNTQIEDAVESSRRSETYYRNGSDFLYQQWRRSGRRNFKSGKKICIQKRNRTVMNSLR